MHNILSLFIAPLFVIAAFCPKVSAPDNRSKTSETFLFNADTWYVDATATGGNNDGTSWQHAFADLQSALAAAVAGDSVWVAKGTYLPTNTLDRGISFNIPKGVTLLGGFAGNEALAAQRNPSANETTLSGDIGQKNDFADNSYHVLYALGSDSETLVDGFTIANGNASADGGGGLYVAADADHPISSPIISNCTFLNNRGMQGGAINAISSDAALAFPVLQNCSFRGNQATTGGGAVYIKGGASYMPQRYVSGCSFVGNKTSGGWGLAALSISTTLTIPSASIVAILKKIPPT
jgi:predicted outer membrane repeat protein